LSWPPRAAGWSCSRGWSNPTRKFPAVPTETDVGMVNVISGWYGVAPVLTDNARIGLFNAAAGGGFKLGNKDVAKRYNEWLTNHLNNIGKVTRTGAQWPSDITVEVRRLVNSLTSFSDVDGAVAQLNAGGRRNPAALEVEVWGALVTASEVGPHPHAPGLKRGTAACMEPDTQFESPKGGSNPGGEQMAELAQLWWKVRALGRLDAAKPEGSVLEAFFRLHQHTPGASAELVHLLNALSKLPDICTGPVRFMPLLGAMDTTYERQLIESPQRVLLAEFRQFVEMRVSPPQSWPVTKAMIAFVCERKFKGRPPDLVTHLSELVRVAIRAEGDWERHRDFTLKTYKNDALPGADGPLGYILHLLVDVVVGCGDEPAKVNTASLAIAMASTVVASRGFTGRKLPEFEKSPVQFKGFLANGMTCDQCLQMTFIRMRSAGNMVRASVAATRGLVDAFNYVSSAGGAWVSEKDVFDRMKPGDNMRLFAVVEAINEACGGVHSIWRSVPPPQQPWLAGVLLGVFRQVRLGEGQGVDRTLTPKLADLVNKPHELYLREQI